MEVLLLAGPANAVLPDSGSLSSVTSADEDHKAGAFDYEYDS